MKELIETIDAHQGASVILLIFVCLVGSWIRHVIRDLRQPVNCDKEEDPGGDDEGAEDV